MICERCGHEHERLHLTRYDECIANLRADKTELRATWDSCLEDLKATRADLEAERARSVSIRDHTLEEAARVADEHWPENGHVHDVGVLSCQATISALIRRRRSGIPRAFVDEEELKAERARSWEGWEYSVATENDFKECHADLIESRRMELDAETRACAAEERAARAEAACTAMRAALEHIKGRGGAVCSSFDTCEHQGCNSSYFSWATADEALAADPSDLLVAVRRLCEAARALDAEDICLTPTHEALRVALADPALASLLGGRMT